MKLGTVALDGTKVHANASRHSALSWEHASKLEARLTAEVGELMALAEAADSADVLDGMSVPEELARREERLASIAAAKAKIEARAKERFAREQAEHEAKPRAREAKASKTGRKPGGRPPRPPVAGPGRKDQVNLTELGRLDRRAIASMAGLAPHACDSGTMRGRRRIWGGRADVRRMLYIAAFVASRYDPRLRTFRTRLQDAGKPFKLAIIATARKLLTILNAMLRDGTDYAKPAM